MQNLEPACIRRRQTILDLIRREEISSQESLRRRLADLGFEVTQATLSRDLKKLRVSKRASPGGGYCYALWGDWEGLPIQGCDATGNLLVIKTEAGLAPAVAYKIDALGLSGILGTVAGEDTVLAAVSEDCEASEVRERLWETIQSQSEKSH